MWGWLSDKPTFTSTRIVETEPVEITWLFRQATFSAMVNGCQFAAWWWRNGDGRTVSKQWPGWTKSQVLRACQMSVLQRLFPVFGFIFAWLHFCFNHSPSTNQYNIYIYIHFALGMAVPVAEAFQPLPKAFSSLHHAPPSALAYSRGLS